MASTALPLKPSILDKLITEIGRKRADGSVDNPPCFVPDLNLFTEAQLRDCIRRDIAWLLNDIHFEAAVDLTDYPEVRTSVLNQGLPDLSGIGTDHDGQKARARDIAGTILAFEPRLDSGSVKVTVQSTAVDNENKLHFSIQGELRNAIEESWVELRTSISLDDGHVEVRS